MSRENFDWTDEELLAFLEEQLDAVSSNLLEQQLRDDTALRSRLLDLRTQHECDDYSLGTIWRQHRISCQTERTWQAYVAGDITGGFRDYLSFHLETVGCRSCRAVVDALELEQPPANSAELQRRVLATTIGRLKDLPPP